MQFIFYVALMAIATFIWGYLFYKKDYHPQPVKVIVQTFIIGLFAMAPIFGYKFIYQNYLPMLSYSEILKPLFESPLLSGLIIFIINLFLLSLILFVFTTILSLVLIIFNHETLHSLKRAFEEEELGFEAVSVMIGLFLIGAGYVEKMFDVSIVYSILGVTIFLAIIEEYVKHLIVRLSDDKKIKDFDDAITLSIMVGLAFAFMENIIYAIVTKEPSLILYRTLLSMPIHLTASGIFGYYYGLAHFATPIVKAEHKQKTYHIHLKFIHKVLTLKRSTIFEEEKIMEGLAFATIFHGGCNILFEINKAFIVIPILVFGIIMISHLYDNCKMKLWMLHKR